MQNFSKSILNYFATYNETRFNFNKKVSYFWSNDEFSLDINIFDNFVNKVFDQIAAKNGIDMEIPRGVYQISLDEKEFKEKISIFLSNNLSKKIKSAYLITDLEKRNEQLRKINLEARKYIANTLLEFQDNKIKEIMKKNKTGRIPISYLNVRSIEQKIYDYFDLLTKSSDSSEGFIKSLEEYITEEKFDLVLFDLYSLILSFHRYVGTNNLYLYFHNMEGEEKSYPLIFIQVSLIYNANEEEAVFKIQNAQNFFMLNTPAINSFPFDRILTVPRASSIGNWEYDVRLMEAYLDTYYNANKSFLMTLNFDKLVKDTLPVIMPRFGLQIVKEEKNSVLDYSELIADFSDSEENKFTSMIRDYVEGNVIDTTDNVQETYRNTYPPRTEKVLIHDLPLALNESQKKIVTAVNNPKNNIVVVDGPPGTGKSYTITALIYNAARQGKSVVITSHKKQALDVIENQLMEQFKKLHPRAKPSIVRLSSAKEKTLNSIENSLSNPSINHANQREASVNLDALEQDIQEIEKKLQGNVKILWENFNQDKEVNSKISRYFVILNELSLPELDKKLSEGLEINSELVKNLVELLSESKINISLTNLKEVFSEGKDWNEILENCEFLYENQEPINSVEIDLSEKEIKDFVDEISAISNSIDRNYKLSEIEMYEKEKYPNEPVNLIIGVDLESLLKCKEILVEVKKLNSGLRKVFNSKERKLIENSLQKESQVIYELYSSLGMEELEKRLEESTAYYKVFTTLVPYLNISSFALDPDLSEIDRIYKTKELIFSLKNKNILDKILYFSNFSKEEITFDQVIEISKKIEFSLKRKDIVEELEWVAQKLNLSIENLEQLYKKLSILVDLNSRVELKDFEKNIEILFFFEPWFNKLETDFRNISTFSNIKSKLPILSELILLHQELSNLENVKKISRKDIEEYNYYIQKKLEYENDKRFSDLSNYAGDVSRILNTVTSERRISLEESKILLSHLTCIIAPPSLISRTFPMEEDIFDTLIIDEASQVSIADSISLILRSKQTVVFGDELQYGAVGAVNVSKGYASQYFRDILDNYAKDKNDYIAEEEKQEILDDISKVDSEDEMESSQSYVISPATKEWLKTFSVRTSTLSFCKAIKNYSDSLNVHFRSYPEIIGYSNEFFYKESQIPLIINRIRTKPISQVLRFEKVETLGLSGQNVNLDEIEFIKNDIQKLYDSNSKLTIGVICSFREQTIRMEEELRKYLIGYHDLVENNKLRIWFVGDVQGEERDIVYYSFVQDKKINNADLRTIYPVVGGTADNIRKLKKQRLNVGFSRAKEQMIFVHSMPLEEYSDSVLGEALKFYKQTLDTAIDNYIEDESVFGSPAEKELYMLIQNTEFFKENRDKLRVIAQFPIGKYIAEEYHRYIPNYRVDFLLSLTNENGRDSTLILEYDGLEYHFKDTDNTNRVNFSNQYLEYDIQRQLELEGYGYKFLRLNKFNLLPSSKEETKVDVLNKLLKESFNNV